LLSFLHRKEKVWLSRIWSFQALDTLFFRDGTPFNMNEPVAMLKSVFPPSMMTLQGAIRTAMAYYRLGWTPDNSIPWPKELGDAGESELKDWGKPDHLGDLRLFGPYLMWKGERLYPSPRILYRKRKEDEDWVYARFTLGKVVEASDLGSGIRFPLAENAIDKGEALEVWLTSAGMEAVLSGDVPSPEHMFNPSDGWKLEHRVGIKRSDLTRTAVEGHLYSIALTRPRPELEVVVRVEGLDESWHPMGTQIVPLGGEGRFAKVTVTEELTPELPRMPEVATTKEGIIRFTVSLLTPGTYIDMDQAVRNGPPEVKEICPSAQCISASLGKANQIGGRNMVKNWPRDLFPVLPAGGTWFFEGKIEDLPKLNLLHGALTGEFKSYGFGQVVIGTWQE
jgi:CRISPR-associated protein Cmr3